METNIPYLVSNDAIPPLLDYCRQNGYKRLFLIADPNTYTVLGQRAESALRDGGFDVKTILLTGEEIATDEHYVMRTFVETGGEDRQYIAVGSGTITDITRFVSHRARTVFISLPTAPSVDGYTSTVAPMVVGRYKGPIQAHPPVAVFADLPTLCDAPRVMIAAGLGDLLGKYTSLADWRLGALLYDEPYSAEIDRMMRDSVDRTVEAIDSIREASCEGITRLMDGLVGSGFGMLAFGDSRPASGSEHHVAHFWEMKFILEGRPAVLHGAKVGVATVLAARRYELLRQMSKKDAHHTLGPRTLPSQAQMLTEIRAGYGPTTERIVQIQKPLFAMTPAEFASLKERILTNWDRIQEIAATVPTPEQIAGWISAAAGPVDPADIGLRPDEVRLGLVSGHYLRDRFTLNRLGYWLNLPLGIED